MKTFYGTLCGLAAVAMVATTPGNAADLVWIGGTGNWNAAANWSPAQVPGAGDNAWITNSGTYTVTVPAGTTATSGSLSVGGISGTQTLAIDRATMTLNSGSAINSKGQLTLLVSQSVLTGAGNLAVNGTLDWANGSLSGAGAINIGSGGVLAIGAGGVTLSRTLNNLGSVTWNGGNLTISAGNSFNNQAGGTFDITADGRLSGAATTPINNSGLFRLTAGNTGSLITAPVNNSGTLQVLATTFSLDLGGTHTGTFNITPAAALDLGGGNHVLTAGSLVAAGSAVNLSGAATLSASGTFGSGSSLTLNSGVAILAATCDVTAATLGINGANCVLNYNSAGPVSAVNLAQGVLGGTSPVTVTGLLTLSGGTITNAMVTANGGLTINGNTTLNGSKLINPTNALWSAGSITGANGATISNLFGATFINSFDGNLNKGAGVTPVFVNAGLLQKTNGTAALGTTSIDFQFINTGIVEVQTNTLRYAVNQQTAGLTLLDGGALSAQAQPIQLLGGSLVGTGLVTVANTLNVVNSAILSPGLPLGELDISGDYQQTASGVLNIELGGYSPGTSYDLITVTAGGAGGVATLGGTLNVTLTNGFSPTNGAIFTFLTAVSRVGAFTTFNYPSNDIGMQLSIDATSAKVTISNLKPVVSNPITNPPPSTYGGAFNFQFPANTFTDPDGDALTYTVSGMPPGITFTSSTRTFTGTANQAGVFPISVIATDNGIPSLTVTNTFTVTIIPATITGSFTAADKVYDGTISAVVLTRTLNGILASDAANLSLTGGTAGFGDASVGAGKTVTLAGATITGSAAANYSLSSVDTTTAAITLLGITGSFTAAGKVYDGTTSATVLTRTLNGVIAADIANISLTGGTASFGTATAGPGKTVALVGATLSGTAAANYSLSSVGTTTAAIAALGITGSFTASDKVYDGSTNAAVLTRALNGVLLVDTANVSLTGGTAGFNTASVGAGKTVNLEGATLTGTAAVNYSLSSVSTTAAAITALGITGSFTAADKVYDGTTNATVLTRALNGVLASDTGNVSLTGGTASFGDASVSAGKTVSLAAAILTGSASTNYSLSSVSTTTANIAALALTGSFTAADKIYDGTTNATVLTRALNGVLASDTGNVSLTGGTASFSDPSAGPDKTVTLAGAAITGPAAGNYSLSSVSTTTATITALGITGSFTAADKVYDGNTSAVVMTRTLSSALTGDAANVSLTGGTANFSTATASPDKTVTLTGATITGSAAVNYDLTSVNPTLAVITPATFSVTADAKTKTFGAADPSFTATYVGFVNDETAAVLGGALAFSRAPGEGVGTYAITPSGLTSSNYAITFNSGTLTITAPAPVMLPLVLNSSNVLITWSAVSNASYRVQFMPALNGANWTNLEGDVLSSGSTASKIDLKTTTNRFYRVQVLP